MDIEKKELAGSRVMLSVSIPWDDWKGEIGHVVEHLSKKTKVDGFRPGRAPKEMLEKKFGKESVLFEGAEHAVRHLLPDVFREAGTDAIGQPEISLEDVSDGGPLRFSVTTAVMPEVKLGSWEKAVKKVNAEHGKKAVKVSDEAVEKELERLAKSRAKLVTVTRPAKEDDAVEIDFDVYIGGVPIENGSGRKHPIVIGSEAFIPGFEEELVGMETGEEKSFSLPFPAEYHEKSLAGRSAEFRVKLLLVQEREIPELSDDFAKSLGRFETLMDLRKSVSEGMLAEEEQKAREKRRTEILDAVVSVSKADLPAVFVESELRRMISEFSQQVLMTGLEFSEYLSRIGKTEDDLSAEWRPQAEKRLLSQLALEHIAADRGAEVSSQEVEAEMNRVLAYAKSVKQTEKDLDLPAIYATVRERIRNEKTLEILETL